MWFKLRVLFLALFLGFSNFGEVAHAVEHSREARHQESHHAVSDSLDRHIHRSGIPELEEPSDTHVDPVPLFSDAVRVRAALSPTRVTRALRVIVRTADAATWASPIGIKIHPWRGPPPRLRAPPAV